MKEFISLSYLGEAMVREAVRDFIFDYTQDLALESSSRLNIVAVQLLSDWPPFSRLHSFITLSYIFVEFKSNILDWRTSFSPNLMLLF